MTAAQPWFIEAFQGDYVDVYAHRDVHASRREARYLRAQELDGPVLDLACGFGRHTLAMREIGLAVFGLDLSAELLQQARRLPDSELLDGRLVRGDARRLPFARESLGAIVNLFSSFGYFGDAGDRMVLCEARRALRPGGRLVLDLMNPPRVRASLVPQSSGPRAGGFLDERRRLVDGGRRVVKDVHWTRADGSVRAWTEDVRLYEPAEITALLDLEGFVLTRIDGGFEGEAYSSDAPREIVHAFKPMA